MASLFRRILPAKSSISDVDDEYSVEYSFALEYSGPPLTYNIPRVVPVDVDRIPTASVVTTASMLNKVSLPIIQPIVKSHTSGKKVSKELNLGVKEDVFPISATNSGELDGAPVVCCSDSHGPSFRVVNVIDNSGELGLTDGEECMLRGSNENESSGTLGFSESHDDSYDLSGSSDVDGLLDREEGVNSGIDQPGFRSPARSSEITEVEESVYEAASPRNRTQIVTFRDPELANVAHKENDYAELIIQERRRATSNVKKGLCHRCLKGNRFMEKEFCIVCNAKYCSKCVLRAMGSMPEGRKCIPCIGLRIDESKRAILGKCSQMLKSMLTDRGVKEIMRSEILCEVNQVPPELVCVNGKSLCHEELVQLLGCLNPPRKLKPGFYWYDKVSGLWGKEGEKPCQFISPQLAVGDPIMQNASNGNTNILVNNREITKDEFWLIKLAGIQCEGYPQFWLSADGSLQEVGQKNVMKRLWDKRGIKLVSYALSLPLPLESANPGGEEADNVADKVVSSNLEQKTACKLLLVGYDQSGTSAIYKQARFLYNAPFSKGERENLKFMIQSNLYSYIGILLEGRERFEEESLNETRSKSIDQPGPSETRNSDQIGEKNIYSISPKLKLFSNWLLQIMMSGNLEAIFPAATREYSPLVEELWKDKAFQATYNRRNELEMLPRVANYFLDRAIEISRTDYEPSDMDILYAEGITSSDGLASLEFSFPKTTQDSFMDSVDQNDPLLRYQLIRVSASSLGENCKWLEMFEDVDLVIFCISLTDYDLFSYDINGVPINKMLESKNLFERIATHPVCDKKDFLLLLTKFDLLEEKIEKVPLTRCDWFQDFNPVISVNSNSNCSTSNNNNNNGSLAQRAYHYIASKYKRLFKDLTGNKLYVSRVIGLEGDSVDEALKYGREVLKWDFKKPNFITNESSSESVEASTS